jgi:hypothetical protein
VNTAEVDKGNQCLAYNKSCNCSRYWGRYLAGCSYDIQVYNWELHTYLLTYSLRGAGYYLKGRLSLSLWKNILISYGTRRFIAVFTQARQWTLSWASWIQFAPSIPLSLRSILMLSSHPRLGLPSGLLPSGLPTKPCKPLRHACHMSRPLHPPWFNHPNNIRWRIQAVNFISIQFSPRSVLLLGPSILNTLFSKTLSLYSSTKVRDQVSHPYSTTGKITVLYILIFRFFYMRREDKRFWTE